MSKLLELGADVAAATPKRRQAGGRGDLLAVALAGDAAAVRHMLALGAEVRAPCCGRSIAPAGAVWIGLRS